VATDLERLANEFQQELLDTYTEAKIKCRYNASRFFQMLEEHGGVETARRLLSEGSVMQTGLAELWKCGRLDISVEAKVLIPKYQPLFSAALRDNAKRRLQEYRFDIEAWFKQVHN
jgi:hypothetical protein